MPRIKGTQRTFVEVEISEEELNLLVINKLLTMIGLSNISRTFDMPYYIRDGKLIDSDEVSAGSHSYFADTVIRDATELDVAVFTIIDKIRRG